MKKRAYLAVLAVCIALTGSACGTNSRISGALTGENGKESGNTESGKNTETKGFGTRLVSVDNVEKYLSLAEYKGLILDKNAYVVTDEQVDEQIRYNLQLEKKEVTGANDGVQVGDLVTINYVGSVNGKTLETEDNYDLTVGQGGMLEGFEDSLIGMKKGETKTVALVFPEDFYSEELSGVTVTYRITLQSFQRTPEITDKLIASKTDAKTLDEYKQMVRQQMEENAEAALQDTLRSVAWDTVLLGSEVREYPQADIENAIDEFKKQVMLYNNESGMDLETFVKSQGMTMEAFQEQCQQYAESKVKQNLIIQGIMDAENISLDDEVCLEIQDQLIKDFGAASLAELLDTYGQAMIDEAIGLIRIENFIVENAVFEDPVAGTAGSEENAADGTDAKTAESTVDEEAGTSSSGESSETSEDTEE